MCFGLSNSQLATCNQQPDMVVITLQRNKCIGCNYCVEHAPNQWAMSGKDGKAVLIHSSEKKGFTPLKLGMKKFMKRTN